MHKAADINRLIDEIYDAATNPEGFSQVAALIAQFTRSRSCAISLQSIVDYHVEGAWFFGVDQATADAYSTKYFMDDPTVVEHFQKARDLAYASEMNCESPIFEENAFFKELCKPAGLGYFAGVYVPASDTLVLRLTVQGAIGRGQYDADDLDVLNAAIPHLRRGVEIHRKFLAVNDTKDVVNRFLEGAQAAVVLLDKQANVVFANVAATELLGGRAIVIGESLPLRRSKLGPDFQDSFSACVAALSGQSAGDAAAGFHLTLQCESRESGLACYMAPIRFPSNDWNKPFARDLVALQIFDPLHKTSLQPELLAHVLGLSPVESQVASSLCAGQDAVDIADKLAISPHTVRGYIKNIYQKMGVSKQSECVAKAVSILLPHLERADMQA